MKLRHRKKEREISECTAYNAIYYLLLRCLMLDSGVHNKGTSISVSISFFPLVLIKSNFTECKSSATRICVCV